MKDYDYAEIDVLIAEARRLRSEAMGEYMARAWQALKRGANALACAFKTKAKTRDRHGRCLPA